MPGVLVGIDIGGTKIHAAAFDSQLNLVTEIRAVTKPNGSSLARKAADVVAELRRGLSDPVDGIGIGVPGVVDHVAGTVRQAVNLGIGDTPVELAALMAEATGVPCRLDNDAKVAALGARQLIDPELDDLAYLSIGTGMAAGIVLGGRLHRGHSGVAGEIGHFPVVPGGPQCKCGLRGCLEVVASGAAIARQRPEVEGHSPTTALVAAVASGDTEAQVVLTQLGDHLAAAVYLLAVTYDVGRIVLGGGVAEAGAPVLDTVVQGIRRLERESAFVRSLELPPRVSLVPEGGVGALGAALLVKRWETW